MPGGFVLLTGEVGTGKTTVCRCLLEQLPANTDIAFIYNPKLTVEELLASVCDELRIPYPEGTKSIKVFIDAINAYLLENFSKGRKTVIILEEAQNLSPEVLEEIRLLTNLETNRQKLLQVIMVGQPELREMLSKPELRQLSQRITARYHLEPLPETDVSSYVNYRLEVAGAKSSLFPESLMPAIYRLSKGVPRLINLICDRALLGAYVQGRDSVDSKTLYVAAKEVLGTSDITAPEYQTATMGSRRNSFHLSWSGSFSCLLQSETPAGDERTACYFENTESNAGSCEGGHPPVACDSAARKEQVHGL